MSEAKPFCISKQEVWEAYKRVKANQGAAGVDEQSIADFARNLKGNLYKIWNRMSSGSYLPPPVRTVKIPKANGGERKLGIPTVSDRIAQTVVKSRLEPAVDPLFHPDSYGYRPGKSALDAVGQARQRCWRYDWILDLDIKGFFDNIPQDLLIRAVKKHAKEQWMVLYIERWLKAPVQEEDGQLVPREKGTPQGGVISPLLANLFLHYAFDRWMAKRNPPHRNIYVGSQAAGERVMESVREWIEKHLRLQVNAAKSGVGRTWERKFLGFRLNRGRQIEAAPESLERYKAKVREMWRSCQSRTGNQLRDAWRRYVRGWWGYYQLAEDRRGIFRLEGWTRRHIRKCFWLRWHEPEGRQRRLRSLGLRGRMLGVAYSCLGAWRIAGTGSLHTALSNATLRRHGFLMPSDLAGS